MKNKEFVEFTFTLQSVSVWFSISDRYEIFYFQFTFSLLSVCFSFLDGIRFEKAT